MVKKYKTIVTAIILLAISLYSTKTMYGMWHPGNSLKQSYDYFKNRPQNQNKETYLPAYNAITTHNSTNLQKIIAANPDIVHARVQNAMNTTLLMAAVEYHNHEAMSILLDNNIDINAQDRLNRTALVTAATFLLQENHSRTEQQKQNFTKSMEILLLAGTNLAIAINENQIILSLATPIFSSIVNTAQTLISAYLDKDPASIVIDFLNPQRTILLAQPKQ